MKDFFEDDQYVYLLISGEGFIGNSTIDALTGLKSIKDELWLTLNSKNSFISKKEMKKFFKCVFETLNEFYEIEPNIKIKNLELENLFLIQTENNDIVGLVDIFFFSNFEIEKIEEVNFFQKNELSDSIDGFSDIVCSRCKEKMIHSEKESESCKNVLRLFYEILTFNKPHPNFNIFLENFNKIEKKILDEESRNFFSRHINALRNGTLTLQSLIKDVYFRQRKRRTSRPAVKDLDYDEKNKIIEMLENSLEDLKKTLSLKDMLLEDMQFALQEVI